MSLNLNMNSSSSNFFSGLSNKFDGNLKDYPVWKMQMMAFLDMYGLSDYIDKPLSEIQESRGIEECSVSKNINLRDGEEKSQVKLEADTLKKKNDTNEKSSKAYAAILFSMTKDQARLFLKVPRGNAYELWLKIVKKYERDTVASKADTINALYECKMTKNESFDLFVSRIEVLVSRLSAMNEHFSDSQTLLVLFRGLPMEYQPTIQALKVNKSLTFEDACDHIRDCQESMKSNEVRFNGAATAHYTHGSKEQGGNQLKYRKTYNNKCFTCGKPGHNFYQCSKNKDAKKCSHCNMLGHTLEECRKKNKTKSNDVSVSLLMSAMKVTEGDNTAINQLKFKSSWILDSGATHHLTNDRAQMFNVKRLSRGEMIQLTTASGNVIEIEEMGCVKYKAKHSDQDITLNNVCYAPNLATNLISVSTIVNSGAQVRFGQQSATIHKNGKMVLEIPKEGNLYVLEQKNKVEIISTQSAMLGTVTSSTDSQSVNVGKIDSVLWHNRLGHLAQSGLKKLVEAQCVNGLSQLNVKDIKENTDLCEGCIYGKSHRDSFGNSISDEYQAKEINDRAHADLYGPINVNSDGDPITLLYGGKYLLTITDEKSRKIFGFILRAKSDAEEHIISWCNQAMIKTGKPLKEFHSDDGGEFRSTKLSDYFKSKGIKRTITNKGTPQHNGIAERVNRTVNEMATSMLHHAKLPLVFWPEAVLTAIYIRNRCITSGNKLNKTPEEIWSGSKPNIEHLKVFGCNAYVHVQKDDRDNKFSRKAKPGIFLGYDSEKLGYRVFNLENNSVIVSRDVQFDENKFTHGAEYMVNWKKVSEQRDNDDEIWEQLFPDPDESNSSVMNNISKIYPSAQEDESKETDNDGKSQDIIDDDLNEQESNDARAYKEFMYSNDPKDLIIEGKRNRRPFNDMMPMLSDNPLANLAYAFGGVCCSAIMDDPLTYEQAIHSREKEQWKQAMDLEYNSLMTNNTWELTELPKHSKAIGCKWIYKKKLKSDGTVERFKARLVAQGFSQQEGIDYNETFAPVVRYKTLRIILAIVTHMDLELHQLDVETAFLNANIQETVYMKQPKGYTKGSHHGQNLVCKLKKTLYGTKQAPHEWNNELNGFIVNELKFKRCLSDTCVYFKRSKNGNIIILAVFVDDIITAFSLSDMSEWTDYKNQLSHKYKIRDLGEAEWILQMKVTRDRAKRTLILDQERYIEKVLKQFNMIQCKEIDTPASQEKLSDADCPNSFEELRAMLDKPYMNVVGSLLYAALTTRLDIAYAVNLVSRFMKNPGEVHWRACKRILRYLQGTKPTGLMFKGNDSKELYIEAYSDADWGGDHNDRKSTTGFIILINGSVVGWTSKKQATVALSTAEAEYMAISATVQEVKWISQLLMELEFPMKLPIKLFSDNQAAISISTNDINHSRTKHIDIRHHYIRDAIKNKEVELSWVDTNNQVADILTKPLAKSQFDTLRSKLMHVNA